MPRKPIREKLRCQKEIAKKKVEKIAIKLFLKISFAKR